VWFVVKKFFLDGGLNNQNNRISKQVICSPTSRCQAFLAAACLFLGADFLTTKDTKKHEIFAVIMLYRVYLQKKFKKSLKKVEKQFAEWD